MKKELTDKRRPYLTGLKCGRCIILLKIRKRWDAGRLSVIYNCARCGFSKTLEYSPGELAAWASASLRVPR